MRLAVAVIALLAGRPTGDCTPDGPARVRFTVRGRCERRHDPLSDGYSSARLRLL